MRTPSRLLRVLVPAIAVAFVALLARPAPAATPDEVEGAIKKAKAYIYSQQKGDNWELVAKAEDEGNAKVTGKQWGGLTAMRTYALLAAGENVQNPKVKASIEWLKTAKIGGHYAAGMRAQVWTFLKDER